MDKLSGLASKLGGGDKSKSSSSDSAGSTGKQDYLDKAFGFAEKKFGGGKLDADKKEKITDTAREQFEKATGKDVPAKISN